MGLWSRLQRPGLESSTVLVCDIGRGRSRLQRLLDHADSGRAEAAWIAGRHSSRSGIDRWHHHQLRCRDGWHVRSDDQSGYNALPGHQLSLVRLCQRCAGAARDHRAWLCTIVGCAAGYPHHSLHPRPAFFALWQKKVVSSRQSAEGSR